MNWDTIKSYIPKNWTSIAAWLAGSFIVMALTAYGCIPPTPVPPPPDPIFVPTEEQANGWHKDDDAVKAVSDTLAFRVFADTPAGKSDDPLPAQVYLWQSYSKLFGTGPPSRDQGAIGSCVGNGTSTAIDRSLATQIVLNGGSKEEFRITSAEVNYGGGRVQIGGGRLGRSDGSVGSWSAQFAQKWGVVGQEKYPGYDLTTYSVSTCRTFGSSGVPAALQAVAKEHPVKDITQVKTWAEAKKALASGYAIAVCSGVGFEGKRNANGVKVARGSWAHCMCLDGYATIDGKECGHIENSWGPQPGEGPVGPGDPPTSGFYADASTVGRMLAENDSWAFSAVKGWPGRAKELNWFVHVQPKQNQERLFASIKTAR